MATTPEPSGGLSDAQREHELARLDPLREQLTACRARQDDLLAERAALLLELHDAGVATIKVLAARAGISDAAVVQQQTRARKARRDAEAAR